MKLCQIVWFSAMLFLLAGAAVFAQNAQPLDEAVRNGVEDIEARLTRGSIVVVLNFRSPSRRLSNYVLDEIMTEMVNNRRVTVVDRASLDHIRDEMDFQMSGDVSDASAQQIGQMLGAQFIISGQLEDMDTHYRMRLRAISVETAAIVVQPTFNVIKDGQMATLMGTAGTPAPAAASAATAPAAAPDTPSRPVYPGGYHFSGGHKVGAGFLNLLYGIGSFTMGDVLGGLLIGGMQLTGNILFIVGMIGEEYTETVSTGYNEYTEYYWEPNYGQIGIGLGLALVANIVGFVRPWSYDTSLSRRRGTLADLDGNPMENISITPVSTPNGTKWGVIFGASY